MADPKVLVCFGDSNTHGSVPMRHLQDIRRLSRGQRWPGVVQDGLGPGWRVHEEGLPGRTTVHRDPLEGDHLCGLAAVPMIIGTHTPIDVVVLALGVNDFKTRFAVTADDIAASIEKLIHEIRAAATKSATNPQIVVVAPPPILETGCLGCYFVGGRAKSEALPGLLGDVSERTGTTLIQAGVHVRSSDVDGIHWDADQHDNLGRAMLEALTSL
jgi:lysophospholipase L1-like esterase